MRAARIESTFFKDNSLRIDASYHINEAVVYRKLLSACPYSLTTIEQESKDVFLGNIFSRIYVADKAHGIPYLSASEMQKSDLSSTKYLSKKQAVNLKYLMLASDWILVSCSGTLGKCVYTDKRYAEMIGTHDLIRIIPRRDQLYPGVMYAFLAGKFGYATLTHSQYGSVVQHTNPNQVKAISIPVFPEELQEQIHTLIVESARLREEADAELKIAVGCFEASENINSRSILAGRIQKTKIENNYLRLDAQYQLGMQQQEAIHEDCPYPQKKISDLAERIFVGDRGKRLYVEHGIPFVSSSNMMLFNAKREAKNISKNNPGIDSLIVHEDDILISRSGTIGNVTIVSSDMAGIAVSEDALRVVIKKTKISPLYVFCYLRTKQAHDNMVFSAFGSVIIHLNENFIGDIKIPILPDKVTAKVIAHAEKYKNMLFEAAQKESAAIQLVEEEIEKWQK